MKKITLSQLKEDLSGFLREAEKEQIVITRRGKPVGILIGFATEDQWFDYCLESHPAFASRIATARRDLLAGNGTRLEDIEV